MSDNQLLSTDCTTSVSARVLIQSESTSFMLLCRLCISGVAARGAVLFEDHLLFQSCSILSLTLSLNPKRREFASPSGGTLDGMYSGNQYYDCCSSKG